ncbi:MAG: hypothetical protein AAFP98_05040 [Pseudomonadota bacterium]
MHSDDGIESYVQGGHRVSRLWLFAPFVGLLLFAGYLGLRLGQPLSETDIITQFAAHYVTQTGQGAAMTDCLAVPSNLEDVRLVVTCTHPDGTVYEFPSGPRGELRPLNTQGDGV